MPRHRSARRQKRSPWFKWIWGSLGVAFLVTGALVYYGLVVWPKSYMQSPDFRDLVSKATSDAIHADGEYENVAWSTGSVFSDTFDAKGRAGEALRRARADSIRVDGDFSLTTAMRRGAWVIDRIHINRVTMLFESPEGSGADPASPAVKLPPRSEPEQEPAAEDRSWFASLIPEKIEIGPTDIAEVNILARQGGKDALEVRGLAATIKRSDSEGGLLLNGSGGTLRLGEMRKLETREFSARLRDGDLFLTHAEFEGFDGARLFMAGEFGLEGSKRVEAELRVEKLDVAEVIPENWQRRLSGDVDAVATVTGSDGRLRQEGEIELKNGVLEALPVLEEIASYTRVDRFRKLVLHTAKAKFERDDTQLVVTDFELQSNGLVRIEGGFTLRDEMIDGSFRVGVTPGTLSWIPGAEQRVFTEESGGFLWTDMRLRGPADAPQEDLTARLRGAAVAQITEDTVNAVVDAPGKILGGLTGSGSGTGESGERRRPGGGLLDTGLSIIGAGVDAVRGTAEAGGGVIGDAAGIVGQFLPLAPAEEDGDSDSGDE
ncbi:MAG: hypothetical protein R3F11_14225 [Verrucomicrobiales bacterium]